MFDDENIILFDSECAFCNFWVKWLVKHDKKNQFKLASFGSEYAKKLNISKETFNSVVLIYGNTLYTKSRAINVILTELGGVYKVLAFLLLLFPVCFSDKIYDLIAARRTNIFSSSCNISMQKTVKNRLIN